MMWTWNLKGRQAVASLDPATRQRIIRSQAMTQCVNKPLLWVIQELTSPVTVGGLSGPVRKVERFLCLLTRLLQISPSPDIVLAMLRQEFHKYVKVAALFVIRLIGNDNMIQEAVKFGLDDYRKIRVYGNEVDATTFGVDTPIKRQRDSDENGDGLTKKTKSGQTDSMENQKRPHYFILRMDELTERLFQLNQPREARREKNTFLGISLPLLVDLPHIP